MLGEDEIELEGSVVVAVGEVQWFCAFMNWTGAQKPGNNCVMY